MIIFLTCTLLHARTLTYCFDPLSLFIYVFFDLSNIKLCPLYYSLNLYFQLYDKNKNKQQNKQTNKQTNKQQTANATKHKRSAVSDGGWSCTFRLRLFKVYITHNLFIYLEAI